MKRISVILKLTLLGLLLGGIPAAAAADVSRKQPAPADRKILRLVFIGSLSGYVKPCG